MRTTLHQINVILDELLRARLSKSDHRRVCRMIVLVGQMQESGRKNCEDSSFSLLFQAEHLKLTSLSDEHGSILKLCGALMAKVKDHTLKGKILRFLGYYGI